MPISKLLFRLCEKVCLLLILKKSDVVILGDLNVNMMPNSKSPKKDKEELLRFSRAFDLTQLIKEPTRISDTSRTLIDLIFVNNEHRIVLKIWCHSFSLE